MIFRGLRVKPIAVRLRLSPCHCGQSEATIRNPLFFAACRPLYRLEKPDFHNRMQAKRSLRKNGPPFGLCGFSYCVPKGIADRRFALSAMTGINDAR
jgi:hypothetical protein